MDKYKKLNEKCPKSCWQNCEYSTECLTKLNTYDDDDWVNGQIDMLIPFLKNILSAIPDNI